MPYQGQRLRIVHDYCVALLQMDASGILKHNLFVYRRVGIGEFDLITLQGIVELLRAAEESRRTLNQMPIGFDTDRVHHQRQWRENFGDAAAIKGRTYV